MMDFFGDYKVDEFGNKYEIGAIPIARNFIFYAVRGTAGKGFDYYVMIRFRVCAGGQLVF